MTDIIENCGTTPEHTLGKPADKYLRKRTNFYGRIK